MALLDEERIPFWKKVVFGTGDIYAGGAQQLVGFLYLFFLTDIIGLRPALAGLIYLVSKIWDAVSDPLFGVLSDRTRTRFGRRRPYFLAGTVLIFLSFASLWLPVKLGTQPAMFLFALAVWLFHETVCSMVLVPFYALGGDLTADYHERNSIMFFRLFISSLTVILVAVLPKIIVGEFADPRLGYAVMGAGFALLFSLPWLVIFFTFPERKTPELGPSLTVREQVIEPLRLKSFRQLMVLFISGYTAVDIMSTVFIFYMTYNLHRPDYHLALGALLIGQVFLLPVCLWLSKRLGKQRMLFLGYVWWIAMIIAMALIAPRGPKFALYVLAFLMGGGSGAAAFLPWAIFPDVADLAEVVYGARREGVFSGFLTFARKCATAVAAGAFGVALDLAGYVKPVTHKAGAVIENIPQPQPGAVPNVILGFLFVVPIVLLGIGIITIFRFKLSQHFQEKLRLHLACQRGETTEGAMAVDEIAAIKDLLV